MHSLQLQEDSLDLLKGGKKKKNLSTNTEISQLHTTLKASLSS